MPISDFTMRLMLLFLPGVLCAYLVDALTEGRSRDRFFFLLRAFVYGMTAYATYWLILVVFHVTSRVLAYVGLPFPSAPSPQVMFLNALLDSNVKVSFPEILFVSMTAVLVGVLLSSAYTHRLLHRLARRLGISRRLGELDVWGYVFNSSSGVEWVTVRDMEHDLIYDGWVRAFSEDSQRPEILLQDVSVYKNSTGERLYQVGVAYITPKKDGIIIEFRAVPVAESVKWKDDPNVGQNTRDVKHTAAGRRSSAKRRPQREA